MEIDRKQILISVLDAIVSISDKEYQKRVWIRGDGPECEDFDEICCNFFGDGDPIIDNYIDFGLTDKQYYILKKFRDEFRLFSDKNNWPQIFIDTPQWTMIINLAKEVLVAFNYTQTRN